MYADAFPVMWLVILAAHCPDTAEYIADITADAARAIFGPIGNATGNTR